MDEFICLIGRRHQFIIDVVVLLCDRRAWASKMGFLFSGDWDEFHPYLYVREVHKVGIHHQCFFQMADTMGWNPLGGGSICHLPVVDQMVVFTFHV